MFQLNSALVDVRREEVSRSRERKALLGTPHLIALRQILGNQYVSIASSVWQKYGNSVLLFQKRRPGETASGCAAGFGTNGNNADKLAQFVLLFFSRAIKCSFANRRRKFASRYSLRIHRSGVCSGFDLQPIKVCHGAERELFTFRSRLTCDALVSRDPDVLFARLRLIYEAQHSYSWQNHWKEVEIEVNKRRAFSTVRYWTPLALTTCQNFVGCPRIIRSTWFFWIF